MSEYTQVEQPLLDQLQELGWIGVDQGQDIPQEPNKSLHKNSKLCIR